MPNISSLTMPDGIVYSIKDSQARKDIEDIKKNGSAGSGGSGGGGAVYVTFTRTYIDNGSTWSCDKTFAELKAAYDAGSVILGVWSGAFPMQFEEQDEFTSWFIGKYMIVNGYSGSTITNIGDYEFYIASNGDVFVDEYEKNF